MTRSGTNSFRGALFEFLRTTASTPPIRSRRRGLTDRRKDDGQKRNQYGVTIGGPIRTDQLFFFFGYQGTNTRVNPTDSRAFVPTPAMLAGDFTAFASPACNAGVQRNLPVAVRRQPDRSGAVQQGGAQHHVQAPEDHAIRAASFSIGLPERLRTRGSTSTRSTSRSTAQHSIFGRHIATTQFAPPPFTLESAQEQYARRRASAGATTSRTALRLARTTYQLEHLELGSVRVQPHHISRPNIDFFSPPEVGINIFSYLEHYMLLNVTGGFTLGTRYRNANGDRHAVWQMSDDLTLVRGGHQYAFGGSFARWSTESLGNVRSPGPLDHRWHLTGIGSGRLHARQAWHERLSSGGAEYARHEADLSRLYAQDTWRIGSRLTLNYGVRWEPFFPQQIENGAVYQFDMERFSAGTKSTVFPECAGRPVFTRATRVSPARPACPRDWNNLGPRVGVAWDPAGDGKTSVRASYGKSFEFVDGQFHLNTSVAPPWGSEVRLNAPPGGLDNPFLGNPGGQTNIFPVTFDQNAPFSLNGPFLSLTNDLESRPTCTCSTSPSNASCRDGGSRPRLSWAAARTTSGSPRP